MNEPITNSYYRVKTYNLYFDKLCSQRAGLRDIPDWLLEDPCHGPSLYRVALNPERGLSGELYEENFTILKQGLEKAKQSGNSRQLEQLQEIYDAHIYWKEIQDKLKADLDYEKHLQHPSKPVKKQRWDRHDGSFAVSIFILLTGIAAVCLIILELIMDLGK